MPWEAAWSALGLRMGVPSTEEAANTVYRLPIPANDELRGSQIMDVETPENGASRILVLGLRTGVGSENGRSVNRRGR